MSLFINIILIICSVVLGYIALTGLSPGILKIIGIIACALMLVFGVVRGIIEGKKEKKIKRSEKEDEKSPHVEKLLEFKRKEKETETEVIEKQEELNIATKNINSTKKELHDLEEDGLEWDDEKKAEVKGIEEKLNQMEGAKEKLDKEIKALVEKIGEVGPTHAPGERYSYSDAGSSTLARIVSVVSGMPAEKFIQTHILDKLDMEDTACNMFQDNPLLGVGIGVGWQTHSTGQEPHNLILELLAETGILGLLAFLGLMAAVIRSGRGVIAAGLLAVAFLPMVTQTVLFEPTWWFAAGLYLAGFD